MSNPTPEAVEAARHAFALSKDPGNGRTTEQWWAVRSSAHATFDAALEKVKAQAKAEALREAADELAARCDRTELEIQALSNRSNLNTCGMRWGIRHDRVLVRWLRARAATTEGSQP